MSGAGSAAATPLMLGISLILIGLVPILRAFGVSERLAYTSCGLAIAVAMLLPWSVWEAVFGQISMNFTTWVVAGLMTVIGAVWVMVYNVDLILGAMGLRPLALRPARPGGQDGDHLPPAGAVSDGRDSGDVHARRLHARHGHGLIRLVPEGFRQRGSVRRRIPGSSRHLGHRPDHEHARGACSTRGGSIRRTSRRSAASRCSR